MYSMILPVEFLTIVPLISTEPQNKRRLLISAAPFTLRSE